MQSEQQQNVLIFYQYFRILTFYVSSLFLNDKYLCLDVEKQKKQKKLRCIKYMFIFFQDQIVCMKTFTFNSIS